MRTPPHFQPGRLAVGAGWMPLDSLDQVEEAIEAARQKVHRRITLLVSPGRDFAGPKPFPLQQVVLKEEPYGQIHSPEKSHADTRGAKGFETLSHGSGKVFYPLSSSDEEGGVDSGDNAQEWSKNVQRVRRGKV